MKTMRTCLFVAFACYVIYLCPSIAAQEIKYPSPDGRFALRITESNPGDSVEGKVELIEKASGRVMIDLGTPWRSQVLVWSRDSKRVAYGNRGYKEGEVSVYFWNGSSFEQVALPEELPSPDIKLPKDCGAVKNYGGAATPVRWLRSGDLELSGDLMMLCRESGATCTAEVRFTLAFDAQHHASVKKVGKTKTEVSE
ncbi:MAG TPA: hypothetical protein VGA01_11150 [Candidatus Binatia bacterium]